MLEINTTSAGEGTHLGRSPQAAAPLVCGWKADKTMLHMGSAVRSGSTRYYLAQYLYKHANTSRLNCHTLTEL